jgi:hypothetical protein
LAWELSSQQQSQQIKGEILVGIPYKQNFSAKVFQGGLKLQFPDYYAHMWMMLTGQPLDTARNIMISYALQRNASHVFYVDQDIILETDTLKLLHETNMPIVGAVYFGRNPPYDVVANINGKPVTREMIIQKRNSAPGGKALMEVHELGFGAMLIDTRVFHRIASYHKLPWFCLNKHPDQLAEVEKNSTGIYFDFPEAIALDYRCKYCNNTLVAPFFDYRLGKNTDKALSEDYFFCELAREAGFSIYMAIHIECEHEAPFFTISSKGLTNSTVSAGIV